MRTILTIVLAWVACLQLSCVEEPRHPIEEVPSATSPERFFAEHQVSEPTALFMIGLSGSGKSYWSEAGVSRGWQRIDSDQLLVDELRRMSVSGEVAVEIGAVPNPQSSEHIYKLRGRGFALAQGRLERAVRERQPVIWDSIGLNDFKSETAKRLRGAGYKIWWLVFHTDDIARNRFNLFLRDSRGGFGSFKGFPLQKRCAALDRMLTSQLALLTPLEASLQQSTPPEVDRIFRAQVADLRSTSTVKDPCLENS